jgi:hypothetical protein
VSVFQLFTNHSRNSSRPHSTPQSPVTLPAFMPSHNRRNVSWCYGLRYFPKGAPSQPAPLRSPLKRAGITPLHAALRRVVRRNEQASRQALNQVRSSQSTPAGFRRAECSRSLRSSDTLHTLPSSSPTTKSSAPHEPLFRSTSSLRASHAPPPPCEIMFRSYVTTHHLPAPVPLPIASVKCCPRRRLRVSAQRSTL